MSSIWNCFTYQSVWHIRCRNCTFKTNVQYVLPIPLEFRTMNCYRTGFSLPQCLLSFQVIQWCHNVEIRALWTSYYLLQDSWSSLWIRQFVWACYHSTEWIWDQSGVSLILLCDGQETKYLVLYCRTFHSDVVREFKMSSIYRSTLS